MAKYCMFHMASTYRFYKCRGNISPNNRKTYESQLLYFPLSIEHLPRTFRSPTLKGSVVESDAVNPVKPSNSPVLSLEGLRDIVR